MTEFDRLLREAYEAGYRRGWGDESSESFAQWRAAIADRS